MRKVRTLLLVLASGALALHCSPPAGMGDVVDGGGPGDTGGDTAVDTGDPDTGTGDTGTGDTGGGGDVQMMGDGAAPASCLSPATPIHTPCWRREPTGDLPNFQVVSSVIRTSMQIRMENFSATSCAVRDRCVAAPGMRRVLRFSFYALNAGPADFYLGPPSGRNAIPDLFTQNSCNNVYELTGWGEYDLIRASDNTCAGFGHKQSFCLMDLQRTPTGEAMPAGGTYNCNNQGIHRGWIDIYDRSLQCQFIDITDVAPGDYILRARVNSEHRVCETDYSDNSAEVMITIP